MLVDGYLHLMDSEIIKRKTYNNIHLMKLLESGKITHDVTANTLDALLEIQAIQPKLSRDDFDFLQKFGIFKPEISYYNGMLTLENERVQARLDDPICRKFINDKCLGKTLTNGILIHGGFFLGPEGFYMALKEMPEQKRKQINMTSVLNVNQVYENVYASEEL